MSIIIEQKPKGIPLMSVFTSSGTWVVPAGVNAAKVTVIGGGGSGFSDGARSRGGGAGGTAIKYISGLVPGDSISVTVGAAGSPSMFGSYCQGNGGGAGSSGGVGSGGGAINGDINLSGQNGHEGPVSYNACQGGSPALYGQGGQGGVGGTGAVPASAGYRGGGGCGDGGGFLGSGAGGSGLVVVEYTAYIG